jgi:tetratricopeptide (TPR) repeat protein/transcriptional regulator with XRE-family HTH domain
VDGAQTVADLARLLRTLRRREARQRRGAELTYRDLATRAGWSHAMVAAYLTGKTLPPTDRFDILIQLLRATPAEQGALATARDRIAEGRRAGEAGTPAAPRQLPADVYGFTGREPYLKELDELVPADPSTVVVAAITGPAGVGKTSLAIHWGHRVRDRFPDGELYANLRGFAGGAPVRPIEALAQFLRTLGVPPDQIPAEVDGAASLFRSALTGRRMLILLDNAAGAEQVRPLLPGSTGCLVLVTSRHRLSGLVAREGARRLSLDLLSLDESRTLLWRVLGAERVAAEPEAVTELARACSRLPLALRIASANLSNHPQRSIAEHVAQLHSDRGLAMLDLDGDEESGVRRAFDLSYRAADVDGQRLFRLLGLVPGPDVTAEGAAALADLPVSRATELLDRLADAHLAHEHAPGRYACHDLLRQYAADRARREDAATVRDAALSRWYGWCLATADAAAMVLYPYRLRLPMPAATSGAGGGTHPPAAEFADAAAALAWLDAEHASLVAAISHAAEAGTRSAAWLLADTLRGYFWLRMHVVDWERAAGTALAAAQADGDLPAQAAAQLSLGDLHERRSRFREAIAYYTGALALSQRAGWVEGQAAALGYLGGVHRHRGELTLSADHFQRALAHYRDRGLRYGEAVTLAHLGSTYRQLGRLPDAITYGHRALALHRESGSVHGEAVTLNNLGESYHLQGELSRAIDHHTRALALVRELGDRGNEAFTLRHLAAVHRDAGRIDQAMESAQAALALARQIGDRRAEVLALNTTGTIHHRLGQHGEAAASHREALSLARATGDRHPEVEALFGLAAAEHRLGQVTEARAHAERARALAHEAGYHLDRDAPTSTSLGGVDGDLA